jgi:DNA (cytosine-5)-methyltransferase 1
MALEQNGWDVVFANDIDPKKFEIYQQNFDAEPYVLGDIRCLKPSMIPAVDLATASFPCIDLSLAGNRAGLKGTHSSTYWEFFRLLKELGSKRPDFVLLENVLGLLTSHAGADLREIVKSLNELGYVCDLLAVDAAWFTPQSRPRLFVVGSRALANHSLPLLIDHPARPKAVSEFIFHNQDLNWRFSKLPSLRMRRKALNQIVEKVPKTSVTWWNTQRKGHLYSQMSPRHKELLKTMTSSKGLQYATVYKRVRPSGCMAELRFDGMAGCLRTPRGGSSKQFLIEAGKDTWRVRNMTAREYARLQGAPDSFRMDGPENNALLGFGDAVCVPAVSWIIRHCINTNLRQSRFHENGYAKGA